MAFTPQYQSWDRVFDPAGNEQLLGQYFSSDSAGADLFPTMAGPQAAVRAIIGDNTYRMSLGPMRTRLDADVRRFPFDFSVGLTQRLTLSATLPIVVTRMNAALSVDSLKGNVGFNPAAPESGNPLGAAQIAALLGQIDASASALETMAQAGQFGCPASATCAQVQSLITRARALRANLATLTGLPAGGGAPLPPAVPTQGSIAGQAILASIANISNQLQAFGGPPLTTVLPLPVRTLGASDVQTILTSTTFGYDVGKFQYTKRWGLGDAEAGVRVGLIQAANARVVLYGTARLPTGKRDAPDNLIDLGTGDRQTDLIAGFEGVVASGGVSLAAAGSYSWQLSDRLDRRATAPTQPIAPASQTGRFERKLGDLLWLGAYPTLALTKAFLVYGSATYYRKQADRYQFLGAAAGANQPGVLLQDRTAMRALSVGGGVAYRSEPRGGGLPIEAGLHYQAAFSGSGGFTPKQTVLTMYLRAFYHLWGTGAGGAPAPEAAPGN